MFTEIAEYFITVVIGLVTVANPLSTAPILTGLTRGMTEVERRAIIGRACIYMTIILLIFLFSGALVLDFFGITIPGLRIAGGLVIGYIGFGMLFPKVQSGSNPGPAAGEHGASIALSPLAMPMLSGPGSIAVIISLAAEIAPESGLQKVALSYAVVVVGIIVTALICWLVLRASGWFNRKLGPSVVDALSRIMGFLLICVAVQFLAKGIKQFITQ